ncbi:MAG: hypothetical protein PVI75_02415 [Gammaproteobacteria bacterium]|jgi:hypothetical protein
MRTLFAWVMIILALVLAVLGIALPRNHLPTIIFITNFFEFMIPVLAVAALINYLWKSCSCCCKKEHE